MPPRSDWTLVARDAEPAQREPADWLQRVVDASRTLQDGFVELEGVVDAPFVAAIDPYYLTPHLMVAAFFSPEGMYTLAILEDYVPEILDQPQLVAEGCKRAVRMPLAASPSNEAELRASLAAAFGTLRKAGVIGAAAT